MKPVESKPLPYQIEQSKRTKATLNEGFDHLVKLGDEVLLRKMFIGVDHNSRLIPEDREELRDR